MENGSILFRVAIVVTLGVIGLFGLRWYLSRRTSVRTSPSDTESLLVTVP